MSVTIDGTDTPIQDVDVTLTDTTDSDVTFTGKTGSAKLDNYYVHHKNKNEHDNSATNLILIPYGSKSIMSD